MNPVLPRDAFGACRGDTSRPIEGDRGWVLAMTALMILPIMAFTSFAVDLGAWNSRAAQLQRAADAGAIAAAPLLPDQAKAKAAAIRTLIYNGVCTNSSVTTGTNPTCAVAKPTYVVGAAPVVGSTTKYSVTVTDNQPQQAFSKLFRSSVSIGRTATAERIKPIPMGSPRNFLGSNRLTIANDGGTLDVGSTTVDERENYWLSVAGYCGRREYGDRITARATNGGGNGNSYQSLNDNPDDSCVVGQGGYVRDNPWYNADGYFYGIEVQPGAATPVTIQVYDAPVCAAYDSNGDGDLADTNDIAATTSAPTAGSSVGGWGENSGYNNQQQQFILRDADSNDPLQTTVLSTTTMTENTLRSTAGQGGDCNTTTGWGRRWRTLGTVTPSATVTANGGIFYVQVKPVIPGTTQRDRNQDNNKFALRAYTGGTWTACTQDANEVITGKVSFNAQCPKVFAVNNLGVYANLTNGIPVFYLASVASTHAGKTLEVELFDSAEGSQYIELLDPNNNPVNFTPEVGCADGSYASETGVSCGTATGETAPRTNGGQTYGPWAATNRFNICGPSGTSTNCGGNAENSQSASSGPNPQLYGYQHSRQRTMYSDRILRLKYQLPGNYLTLYGSRTWWKIRYTVAGNSFSDRTTWTVRIKGDPVRLVPNV